jgi:hypothetical protein
MSLKLITLAAFAATAQAAACTAAETTKQTECKAALVAADQKTPATKDTICKLYTDMLACYPQCACTADKAVIDADIVAAQAAVKAIKGGDCPLKCGAGSALAPGMALTLALMVAARLYE